MRILKLPPYCAPEVISSSHLAWDLNEELVRAGHIIENYAPTPTRGISKEVRKKYKKIKYEERNDGRVIIHRFALFGEGRNPVLRAIRYVLCNLIQYGKGCRAKNIDMVYAGSTPPTQGLLCALVAKRLRKKYKKPVAFVFNLQDMFPESLVSTGMTKEGSLLWKIGNWVSNVTYRNADHIIVICDSMKDRLVSKGVPAEKISVVYNWIDTDATHPVPRQDNPLFEELGLSRDLFYVTYAGNLGNSQNVSLLVDCAAALKDQPDIRFVIFGEGSEKEKLSQQIASSGLTNIQLLPWQPVEKVSQVYSLSDASFVLCKKGVGEGAFPSKAASIMATGTPVIASFDMDSDLCQVITRNEVGLCADAEDVPGAVAAILRLYEDRQLQKKMGENARALACERFSKEAGIGAMLQIYRNACASADKS